MTTNDIKPQELYTKLVTLSKKDDEKEEKERTLTGILESIILFIRKSDFDRLQKPVQIKIKPVLKQAKSQMEGLVEEVHAWTGIDKNFLLSQLLDKKDEQMNSLGMYLTNILRELEETTQKNKDKLKKLEVDKKTKELDALKKRLADAEEKKQQEISDKVRKYCESQSSDGKESVIDVIVKKSIEEMQEGK